MNNTEIEILLKKYKIKNHSIRDNGMVDVNGSVNISDKNFAKLPFTFGIVNGNFDCSNNSELITLEGSPYEVTDSFVCSACPKLESLNFAPKKIGMYFNCYSCESVQSLIGFNSTCVTLVIKCDYIKHGGISLLGVVRDVAFIEDNIPFKIIEKYINKPDDIFECQAELIEAGYEEYARL